MGATAGPATAYSWTTAGLGPQLLPWLAVLALLALKPNRGWSPWLIWLALAGLAGGRSWLLRCLQNGSNPFLLNACEVLLEVPLALAFGLAALWLMALRLNSRHRFTTFLGILAVLLAFMGFCFAARVGWGMGMEPIASLLDPRHLAATASSGVMATPFFILLLLPAPMVAAAMALCSLACRQRRGTVRLCLWLFLSLLGVWVAVSVPAYGWCRFASPGEVEYLPCLTLALLMTAVSFATMLPFLILSLVNPFFRQRLQAVCSLPPG